MKKGNVELMKVIYIPLCLYLYFVCKLSARDIKGFTFHYVYIYINGWEWILCCKNYLHSTMFIFILCGGSLEILRVLIYIPLCLYLYI